MPRREDLKSVLVIGSGPIVIGQGCEFDYSGTQACRVLKQEGIRVSLVNSNPATIMTDPGVRRRDLRRADHDRDAGEGHRHPAPGRRAAHPGRPDRAERGRGPARPGRPAPVQRRADRREHRRDPGRRGPRAVQGDRHRPGRRGPEQPDLPRPGRMPRRGGRHARRSAGSATRSWSGPRSPSAASAPASPERGRPAAHRRGRAGREPDPRGPAGGEHPRLEGVRARADARRQATTWSSSARSRTSTRWACTPATRSRSPRP